MQAAAEPIGGEAGAPLGVLPVVDGLPLPVVPVGALDVPVGALVESAVPEAPVVLVLLS